MAGVSRINCFLLPFIFSVVQGFWFCPKPTLLQGTIVQCLSPTSFRGTYTNCSEMLPIQTLARISCQPYYKSQDKRTAYWMKCGSDGKWLGFGHLRCYLDAVGFVEKLVNSERVLIFGKSTCSYCQETKDLFDHLGEKYMVVEVDHLEPYKMELLRATLWEKTGMRTWPNVFVNGRHVGGNEATKRAYQNGNLMRWLNRVGT